MTNTKETFIFFYMDTTSTQIKAACQSFAAQRAHLFVNVQDMENILISETVSALFNDGYALADAVAAAWVCVQDRSVPMSPYMGTAPWAAR